MHIEELFKIKRLLERILSIKIVYLHDFAPFCVRIVHFCGT